MFKLHHTIILGSVAAMVSACTTVPFKNDTWRATALTSNKTIEVAKVEEGLRERLGVYAEDALPFEGKRDLSGAANYDMAKTGPYVYTRNNAQSYLKAVSEIKCGNFKTWSLSEQANTNMALSSASTILGGVGGLLSPESTAQALAASSAMLTGIQSSVNQNYYREKTFEIITKAIDVRRKTLWANIEAKRARHGVDNYYYLINDAVADMIDYNNACSVIAGFEELANAVKDKEKQVDKITGEQKLGVTAGAGGAGFVASPSSQRKTLSVEENMATGL